MKTVFAIVTLLAQLTQAKNHGHRHLDAHVHGAATLSIAFDNLSGTVEFKAASQGILGFEREAKSEKDKAKLASAIATFETGIGKMVQFEESLGCMFNKEKIEMIKEEAHDKTKSKKKKHGEHSDFVANFKVTCTKSVLGSKMTVDFTAFPKIADLDVTVLVGDLQKSFEVKKKPVTFDLKK